MLYTVPVPRVRYQYSVNGVEYSGHALSFGRSYSRGDIMQVSKKFPVGHTVAVYYDPANPERSVLMPGGNVGQAELTFDILLVLVGLCLLLVAASGASGR